MPALTHVSAEVAYQVTCDVKYEGYLARQEIDIERQRRLAEKRIPDGFNYDPDRAAASSRSRPRPLTAWQTCGIDDDD